MPFLYPHGVSHLAVHSLGGNIECGVLREGYFRELAKFSAAAGLDSELGEAVFTRKDRGWNYFLALLSVVAIACKRDSEVAKLFSIRHTKLRGWVRGEDDWSHGWRAALRWVALLPVALILSQLAIGVARITLAIAKQFGLGVLPGTVVRRLFDFAIPELVGSAVLVLAAAWLAPTKKMQVALAVSVLAVFLSGYGLSFANSAVASEAAAQTFRALGSAAGAVVGALKVYKNSQQS